MKQALAIDPVHILNFYITDLPNNDLGYARFPWDYSPSSFMHGVVCAFHTLPGGQAPFDEGDTGVHEIGHYAGLYHTFQGGCTPPGDEVDDTPYENEPAFGCPQGRNTCQQAGDDPIENFMNYSNDACMNHFTAGQSDRMDAIMAMYRPEIFEVPLEIDQVREGGSRLVGTNIGRWNGSTFIPYPVPNMLSPRQGTQEILQAKQDLTTNPTEKYNRWNEEEDVTNHHVFDIDVDFTSAISNFKRTHSSITLQNNFLTAAPGSNPADDHIYFKDPWLIDYADPNYGGNLRNQGMSAPFEEADAPFTPNTGSGPGSEYLGVFLDESGPPSSVSKPIDCCHQF